MKTLAVLVASSVMATLAVDAIGQQHTRLPAPASLRQLVWLSGEWRGAAGPMSFEERWTEAAGGLMLAVARTLKGDQLASFEYLRIVERNGSLVYVAQPNGRPPTEFILTAIDSQSATFENPAHDYPKLIRYSRLPDGTLEAVVGDGDRKADTFRFTRVR